MKPKTETLLLVLHTSMVFTVVGFLVFCLCASLGYAFQAAINALAVCVQVWSIQSQLKRIKERQGEK